MREQISSPCGHGSRALSVASSREVAFADGMKLSDLRNDHLDLIWALNPVMCVSRRARQRNVGDAETKGRAMRGWKQSQSGAAISPGVTWSQQSRGWP